MTNDVPKRRGRPAKQVPKDGQRVSLGLRVTPEIKRRLDAVAAASGRSQSQEAEMRLERSFREDAAIGGVDVRSLVNLITSTFAHAGQIAAHGAARPELRDGGWLKDRDCYRQAVVATADALMRAMPGATEEDHAMLIESLKGRFLTRFHAHRFEGSDNG